MFDGQKLSVQIPVIKLAELSIREIAERNLLPIGQFYLRTFETLTAKKIDNFKEAAASLLSEVRNAVENNTVPYYIGIQMQDTIRKTLENVIIKSGREVDFNMTTNITETLPWTDYRELFEKIEERGKAEGKAEGMAEVQINIAVKFFEKNKSGMSMQAIIDTLHDFGIPDSIISTAKQIAEADKIIR